MKIKTSINWGLTLAAGNMIFSGSGFRFFLNIMTVGNILFQDSTTMCSYVWFIHSHLSDFNSVCVFTFYGLLILFSQLEPRYVSK